jgi:hypothetical protein
MTLLFVIFGGAVVSAEALGLSWARYAWPLRLAINLAWLSLCFASWRWLVSFV